MSIEGDVEDEREELLVLEEPLIRDLVVVHQQPHQTSTKNATFTVKDNVVVMRETLPKGSTELHFATATGNLEVLEDILLHSKVPTQELIEGATTEDGRTALHIVASLGHEKLIRPLLEHGADVRRPTTKFGLTPLHLASIKGHSRVIEQLLPSLTHEDLLKQTETKTQHTSLHLAALNGRLEAFKLLHAKLNEMIALNPLKTICSSKQLLRTRHQRHQRRRFTLPWKRKKNSSSPSSSSSHLISNLRASDGSTLLHCAVAGSIPEEEEASPSSSTRRFNAEGIELLLLLIQLGADVLLSTEKGWTPLHLAAALGCEKACDVLLTSTSSSSSSTTTDTTEEETRGIAKKKKRKNEKRSLLKMKTKGGLTPFDIAKLHQHDHLFLLLDPKNKDLT